MESLKLCISMLLLLAVRADSQICPVLEGERITLTCTVLFRNSFGRQFYWRKRINGASSFVGICDPNNGSSAPSPPYTCIVTNINASSATSNITIHSTAITDQGSWFCGGTALTNDSSDFHLKVFATPTNVSCSLPELHNDNVIVTCTGDKVYPQPLCQFTWTKNGTQQSIYNVAVKNQSMSQSQNRDYFYPECTSTIPVQTLGFGSHQFHVLIYPSVTGNTATDMSYGRNSNQTSSIAINAPEVFLESCPVGQLKDGYIKEGTTASCTCIEKNNSFLKANVSWSWSPGGSVMEKQTSTLNITAKRNGPNYICEAEVLGAWSNKTFEPDVAYGPDQVVMKVQMNGSDKTVTDLCDKPQTHQTMTVSCTVPDVRPNATVRYFINGNDQTVASAGSVDYPVTGGGNLSLKCTANNTIYPEIYNETTIYFLVREPPNTPFLEADQLNPISSTTKVFQAEPGNDQQVTVREGLVRIWCRVDGGYPNVTNLMLNCNGSSTSGPNAISVKMNVTRKMNSLPCFCTATHPSTCYVNNSTTSTLNVHYPPAITNFTITGAVNQEVQDNTNVMFSCEAEGNPAPSLTLLRDSDSQILGQTDSNNKAVLQLNKAMGCQDSGIYVCTAQSQEGGGRETVKMYVLCKQHLGSMESQNKVYSIKANETFDINITVFGYPEPQLSLHSSKILHKNEYNLTYYNTTPGNGFINLKIHTVPEAYYQKYDLNISNTQGSFVYSFEIKAENTNDDGGDYDIGAIIGGIAAGVVAIILVALGVFLLRRKGFICSQSKNKSADDHSNILPPHSGKGKNHGKTPSKKNGSDLVTIDNTDIYNMNSKPNDVVVIDNGDIYNMGRGGEVVIDNSDVYNMGKSSETVIDNSDIYNMNRDSTVEIDNSDIYNMNRNHAADSRASAYRNYSDITPTITSAATMPRNMKPVAEEPILDNPYEDVEKESKSSAPKVQQKPQVTAKPKVAMKPNQGKATPANTTAGDNKDFQLKDIDVNQTYAVINKIPKSDTLKQKVLKKPSHDDGFPDQSQTPTVPEKKYEKADKEKKNGRMKEKAADKSMKGTSPEDTSHVYTNKGYSDAGDDVNVYANT